MSVSDGGSSKYSVAGPVGALQLIGTAIGYTIGKATGVPAGLESLQQPKRTKGYRHALKQARRVRLKHMEQQQKRKTKAPMTHMAHMSGVGLDVESK